MPPLTKEEQKSYYETQGNAANPLSPLAYLESLNTASGKTHEPTILSTMNAGKVESKINTIANTGTEATTKRDEIVGSRPEPTPPDLLEDETPENKIIRLKEEAFKKSQEAYDNFTIANTEEASADVADLKRQWEKMYKTQEEINRSQQGTYSQALLRTGTSRYTPETGADVMADVQNKGLEKLGEINAKYESAIAKTKAAMKSKNYELAYKAGQEAQDYYDKSLTEIRKQRDEVAKLAKEKADAEAKVKEQLSKDINEVLSDAVKNGLTNTETLAKMQGAGSVGEAMAYAGNYLQTATGDAGDYLFVKRQASENGASVPSFETWKNNIEQQKLNTELAKFRAQEGIRFNYSMALEKAKNALANQPNPNYHGEFEATVKLAAAAGTSQAERQSITSNLQDFISNGDYNSAYAQILSSVQQKLKGTASTKFSEQVSSKEVLADLTDAIKAYSAAGGKMNIFKGTEDEIQTKIGALVTDPKYASLAVQLDSTFQAYRQQMTGAAFGAQESAEYAKVLPGKGNTLDLNLAKLNGANTYLDSAINGTLRTTVGEGGIYIRERADAAAQTVNQSAKAGDTIASFVASSPENEQRYNELKELAPDASPEEIMQQLGIQ